MGSKPRAELKLSSISPQGDRGNSELSQAQPVRCFWPGSGSSVSTLARWAKSAIGKQNAVHYDIASYTTDRFNVFGGQGTHAYVAGTDGGETGTGRADRIVNYQEHAAEGPGSRGSGAISRRRERNNYGRRRRLIAAHVPAGCKGWRDLHPNQLGRFEAADSRAGR